MVNFTLNHPLFIDSLLAGIEGSNDMSDAGLEVYLIGGGAVQHYAAAVPELRRPTVDVDLQNKIPLPHSVRNQWAEKVEKRLEDRRRKGIYHNGRTKTGGEVRVETEDKSPFFVHLDLFTPTYIKAHQEIIDASFERKRPLAMRGQLHDHTYFVQAPEDIAYHKLKRLIFGLNTGRLTEEDEKFVRLMASGLIDDTEVGDMYLKQEALGQLRNMTLEEVARQGFENVTEIYNSYRDKKGLYDIALLVASHKYRPIFQDTKIIRQNIEMDENILPHAQTKRAFI